MNRLVEKETMRFQSFGRNEVGERSKTYEEGILGFVETYKFASGKKGAGLM